MLILATIIIFVLSVAFYVASAPRRGYARFYYIPATDRRRSYKIDLHSVRWFSGIVMIVTGSALFGLLVTIVNL